MFKYLFILPLSAGLLFTSCDNDDPIIPNEEEVITTLIWTLVSPDGDEAVFTFRDIDGDGGVAPVVTAEALKANTIYVGSIRFVNELEEPSEEITAEVAEEADEHQVFYASSDASVTISTVDVDADGNPLGLATRVSTTGALAGGSVTITLLHEPSKDAAGVSDGQIANAGGETDIEVTFPLDVE